jgi:hypothetical protein
MRLGAVAASDAANRLVTHRTLIRMRDRPVVIDLPIRLGVPGTLRL